MKYTIIANDAVEKFVDDAQTTADAIAEAAFESGRQYQMCQLADTFYNVDDENFAKIFNALHRQIITDGECDCGRFIMNDIEVSYDEFLVCRPEHGIAEGYTPPV